jgi:hypothetical protein
MRQSLPLRPRSRSPRATLARFCFAALPLAAVFAVHCSQGEKVAFVEPEGPAPSGPDGGGALESNVCEPSCGDGVCIRGACCDRARACGNQCCGAGDLCSFGRCVTPGKACAESTECVATEYCEFALGSGPASATPGGGDAGTCTGGVSTPRGKCLPRPPTCADGEPPNPDKCLAKCELRPNAAFDPVLKYAWGGQTVAPFATDVMMTPIVIQLDDDNCDGRVTEADIPEIVFSTFTAGDYRSNGTLRIISIVGGKVVEKLSLPGATQPGGGLAAGDLDGDKIPDIVACAPPAAGETAANTGVVAYRRDGSVLWRQTDSTRVHCGYEYPAIGDVDRDGKPEVLIGFTILDGQTGAVKRVLREGPRNWPRLTSFADLDGDGLLDVTDGITAYRGNGSVLWDLSGPPESLPIGFHAIGDMDGDTRPEVAIVSTAGPHTLAVIRYDPTSPTGARVIRRGIDINNGISTATFCGAASEYGGGPPTVADFDGDGVPDVGVAGAVGYNVFSGAKLMNAAVPNAQTSLWFKPTRDCSSAVTGSSVFDFDGDGKAEVIYADEWHLWMFDGATGNNLIASTCNTNGTLWEYPVIADVDNDGQADIVVASNAYALTCPDDNSKQAGIRVFSSKSGSWVRTRRVWNQHTYHVTNIEEDGTVPTVEKPNWRTPGLNNFRQNKQPGSEFAAPDAIVSIAPRCPGSTALDVTVRNVGEAAMPPGVRVGLYKGNPGAGVRIAEAVTTGALYPAQAEVLSFPVTDPDLASGALNVYASVDDVEPRRLRECRVDNNTTPASSSRCSGPR